MPHTWPCAHLGLIGGSPSFFASVLNGGSFVASTRANASVCTFSSAAQVPEYRLGVGDRTAIALVTPSSEASRLLILMGKLSGSCPLWLRTW